MKQFCDYFSDESIIKCLISIRIAEAKKRREIHFIRNISSYHNNVYNSSLDACFPSRRSWIRPRLVDRKTRNPTQVLEFSLYKTLKTHILRSRKPGSTVPEWLVNLNCKVQEIKNKALGLHEPLHLKPPHILAIPKDSTGKAHRPIAVYENNEKIIISRVAKYLTDLLDETFLPCSVAFRATIKDNKTDNTHHGTVEKILQYQNTKGFTPLWAAECDIKKFFDCINHDIARSALYDALNRKNNNEVDTRALEWYNEYLNSYSFNIYVKSKEKSSTKSISFDWISNEELMSMYTTQEINKAKIGIPQGGAISCLIANLVMHKVDQSIMNTADHNLLYLRYCDDMILVHPEKELCQSFLLKYYSTLYDNKLCAHTPVLIDRYEKSFWSAKSKSAYKWANPTTDNTSVPWLSFVGYQLRYDGYLRIRPKSIEKEMIKQVTVIDNIIKSIKPKNKKYSKDYSHVKLSNKQIIFRARQKLISMSIGRISVFGVRNAAQFCWVNGFRLIGLNPFHSNRIKSLDKNREKQIKRLKNHLLVVDKYHKYNNIKAPILKYYGKPFSYLKGFSYISIDARE